MTAVDTNILIYVHDLRDAAKQAIASALVTSLSDGALLWQVACEYLAASRKLSSFGYDATQAWADIQDLRNAWTAISPDWNALDIAASLHERFSLSHWDALLVAACLDGGVTRLYSEDFDAYPEIDGLSIVNPFRPRSA